MGSSKITSKADKRSEATINNLSSPTAYMSRTLPRPSKGNDCSVLWYRACTVYPIKQRAVRTPPSIRNLDNLLSQGARSIFGCHFLQRNGFDFGGIPCRAKLLVTCYTNGFSSFTCRL